LTQINIRLIKKKAHKSLGHICPKKEEAWGIELNPVSPQKCVGQPKWIIIQ